MTDAMPRAHPVTGIDHCFLLVRDLDASRDAFERFGFTVSPRGLHSAYRGSANHTIMFPDDYIELLGLIKETDANAPRRAMLEREGEGLHALAFRVEDAIDAQEALGELGIATDDVADFSRPVTLPGGGEATASFSTLDFAASESPLGYCFMCQHRTRDLVWIPDLLEHANGAVGLAGFVAAADDPDRLATGFARLFAGGSPVAVAGGVRVETGARSAPLVLLSREALARHYHAFDLAATPRNGFTALRVAVRDVGGVRALLAQRGIESRPTPLGIAVDPALASGAVLEFVPA